MKRSLPTLAGLVLILGACSEAPTSPTEVEEAPLPPTAEARVGANSAAAFQAAVARANADERIRRIVLEGGTISLDEPVVFSGPQDIVIDGGTGATLDFSGVTDNQDGLVFTGGGDVTLRKLTLANAPGSGGVVRVPADAQGTLAVRLIYAQMKNNGLHGFHVDDQTYGSDASIRFRAFETVIMGNGFNPDFSDFDGIRVDEGGEGDLEIDLNFVTVSGNAGDGNEYDERGAGDVIARVRDSTFDDNGSQPQDPEDLEDGFDIDEADDGDIRITMVQVSANATWDEGIDLDEGGNGSIHARLVKVTANGNLDENIKFSEGEDDFIEDENENLIQVNDTDGGVFVRFNQVIANGSQDGDGIKLEEFGRGDFEGVLRDLEVTGNWSDGLEIEQLDEGEGFVRIRNSNISENDVEMDGNDDIDLDGVASDIR